MLKVCQRYAKYPVALKRQSETTSCKLAIAMVDQISKTLITDSLSNMDPRGASASKKRRGRGWGTVSPRSFDILNNAIVLWLYGFMGYKRLIDGVILL